MNQGDVRVLPPFGSIHDFKLLLKVGVALLTPRHKDVILIDLRVCNVLLDRALCKCEVE